MLAALASPCRIKRNHRRRRRVASGRAVYGYVGGNPLSFIDPFGLSPADVIAIQNGFNRTVTQMTNDGLRMQNKTFNNTCRDMPWLCGDWHNKLKDCGEQTDYMNDALRKGKYQDHWAFYMDAAWNHAWGVARSSNPNDPLIWYDTRADQFSVGEPCPGCHGFIVGQGGYSNSNPPPPPSVPHH
jgi:hypothetical protein